MKKNIFQSRMKLIVWSAMIMIIASCKKQEDTNTDPARIFKPSEVKVTAGQTSAKLTWTAPLMSTGKTLKYGVDFSTDSLFSTIKYSTTSDTAGVNVTEDNLTVRTKYYARVKALATTTQPESRYVISSAFQIMGLQYFNAIQETEIKETSVKLRFQDIAGLSSIVLTPATGSKITVVLNATDITAKLKEITGLTASTKYNAELFIGTRSVGYTSFTTLSTTTYTTILSSGADLAAAVSAAANGAVIGLNDGTYNVTAVMTLTSKAITLKSVNNNPDGTIVNFKGFALSGAAAGIKVSGIDFNGAANSATYFVDLSNTTATVYGSITAENSYIHNIGTGIIRGDRAAHTIGDISFRNCKIYAVIGSSSYYMFHLDKSYFPSLTVSQCTMYNFAPGLVNCKTPLSTTPPTITFNLCTINNFGFNSLYVLLNASTNPANFSMTNCVVANTPYSGTVLGTILSSATSSSTVFSNNNYFNLIATAGGAAISIPSTVTQVANQTINIGWTAATTDFTLPTTLKTASSTSGPIGDPRWTN